MIKLSVAIITFNEEQNIRRCLESIKNVADEIVVVDSFSTDSTKKICGEYNVKFVEHEFSGHIEQKNYALSLTSYNYVLSLDADESLDDVLKNEILKIKESFTADGYYFNRLTNYSGHWVKHCGWYPDRKLRLFKKEQAIWGGKNPHDIIVMKEGSTKLYLKGDLLHYSYNSISDHINQTNKFTTIAAKVAFDDGKKSSLFKILTRPPLKFLRDYFFKLGFLDGRHGFIICVINGLSAFLKYSKLYEFQKSLSK